MSRELGRKAEDEAAAFLGGLGFRVLEMRWSCRLGELDIIAMDGDTLVFVEVKARSSPAFGSPAEAVTPAKQARIIKAGLSYLKAKGLRPGGVRFDVVCFNPGAAPEHIRDAFQASGYTY